MTLAANEIYAVCVLPKPSSEIDYLLFAFFVSMCSETYKRGHAQDDTQYNYSQQIRYGPLVLSEVIPFPCYCNREGTEHGRHCQECRAYIFHPPCKRTNSCYTSCGACRSSN